jgi:hypothetical protein
VYVDASSNITAVGVASTSSALNPEPIIWSGTSFGTVTDLSSGTWPYGFIWGIGPVNITGTTGLFEAGYAMASLGNPRAFLWNDSSSLIVDLQTFVSASDLGGYAPTSSEATGVDVNGAVSGWVASSQGQYACVWNPAFHISGTVALQNWTASLSGTSVTFKIRNASTMALLDTETATLDASGNFSFPLASGITPGTYYVSAQVMPHWLRQGLTAVVVGYSGASGLSYSLINGDRNGDNTINSTDLSPVVDINGDGSANSADTTIITTNLGLSGDY